MTMEEKIDWLMNAFMGMQEKVDSLMTMQEKVDVLVEKVEKLEEDVKELKEDVKELKARVAVLEKDHESINRTLILIEDDTSNKIPALFDGYSFHQQHIEEDEKRLDVLENVVDEHSIRISALEQVN